MALPGWDLPSSVARIHSALEAGALLFFAALVVFDVLAHILKNETRKHILESIGLFCFGIAVLCEIAAYPYGKRNDDLSSSRIAELNEKAELAGKDSKQLGIDLAKAKLELTTKQGELEDKQRKDAGTLEAAELETAKAQVELLHEIERQGPRGALIESRLGSDERLKRFKGQRVEIWMCGGLNRFDEEKIDTWSRLWAVLNRAGWTATQFGEMLACGGTGVSAQIFVSPQADARTRNAANVLASAIGSALLFEPSNKVRVQAFLGVGLIPSLGSPNTIAVLLFGHPK